MDEKTSTARVALKWGLIIGVGTILYSTLLFVLNLTTNRGLSVLGYGIFIAGLVLAMREFRTANGGYMTYGEGVGLGALASAIAGVLSSAYSILYMTVIDTGFRERLMEQTREQLEEQGQLTDEQIDQAIEMGQSFQSPGLLFVFGIFGSILIGVVLSLIIAAIMRRNKANPFE
ncbi:DUF4199 domain-containing protein [Fibrisoma montanum]|uniref:DUF4199 domain-containing protein n=1 Tax=Fibrisoma montanum TaxID=2305895 RepID=A0A418M963_9BACT|nr:DUF4199 domain-containing protein [Fibrisoma montanum]RIV22639.1 DUF4199 domain-containing protein [Fibrisoma montanum]